MAKLDEAATFGYASTCESFQDVTNLLRDVIGEDARSTTAAFGMLLTANLAKLGPYREEAVELLDQLARAKAELDIAATHRLSVVEVTAEILLAAQKFADEMTIPATEWASVEEITAIVLKEAKKFAKATTWKLYKYDEESGAVVGSYTVDDNGKKLDDYQQKA